MADQANWMGLFSDPVAMMGMNLLSNARQPGAVGNAFGLMQKMQSAKQDQLDRAAAQQQLIEHQTALEEHQRAQEKIAQSQFERQQMLAENTLRQQQAQEERNVRFMEQASGMLGGPKYTPPPTPQNAPTGPVGKFGTPSAILDNLRQTESSGNPLAIGPAIPGSKERAMGAYQFLPSTVNMLKQQGITFDPFNHDQSRDAADQYLQMLMKSHGGDMQTALAAYGGFKTKDPTSYLRKVMGGAAAPQPAASTSAAPSGMDVAKLGALGAMAGVKGANSLVEVGKMMQPQSVPAGGYQRGADGSMTFVPDPYREQGLKLDAARVNNDTARTADEQAKTSIALEEKKQKQAEKRASAEAEVRSITGNMSRLYTSADTLLKHPGLPQNTGLSGVAKLYNLTPTGRDASVLLEGLKDKLVTDTLKDLKSMSSNGSSGYGSLSVKEGSRLENYISNLSRAQTLPQMQKALEDIKAFSKSSSGNFNQKFEEIYGGSKKSAPVVLPGGWKVVP